MTYEEITTDFGSYIKRTDEDGLIWSIPTDPTNSDYQQYLAWLNGKAKKDGVM